MAENDTNALIRFNSQTTNDTMLQRWNKNLSYLGESDVAGFEGVGAAGGRWVRDAGLHLSTLDDGCVQHRA